MRLEIDTEDLVELVKQFLTANTADDYLLEEIEEMMTYGMEDFKHEVEIVKL